MRERIANYCIFFFLIVCLLLLTFHFGTMPSGCCRKLRGGAKKETQINLHLQFTANNKLPIVSDSVYCLLHSATALHVTPDPPVGISAFTPQWSRTANTSHRNLQFLFLFKLFSTFLLINWKNKQTASYINVSGNSKLGCASNWEVPAWIQTQNPRAPGFPRIHSYRRFVVLGLK